MNKLLLRVTEAAELASVSRSTAYELVAQGAWPCVRVGSGGTGVRVVYADLLEWVEQQKRHGYGTSTNQQAA